MWQLVILLFLNGEVKMELPIEDHRFETQRQCEKYRDEHIEEAYHKFKRSEMALIFDGINAYCEKVKD